MIDAEKLTISKGLSDSFRLDAARLYDEAFGKKFSVAVKNSEQRISLLEACFKLDYAFVAIYDNKLVGIAGYHTIDGSLTGGLTYKTLISKLGIVKGNWAALIFSLYERKSKENELLMDGIAVSQDYRGLGIGSQLIDSINDYAKSNGYQTIRLDVISTNPAAKKLYERKGFITQHTEKFPYLEWLLGFSSATTMVMNVK